METAAATNPSRPQSPTSVESVPQHRASSASELEKKHVRESANESLVEAARRGNANVLRACLEYGCSPNAQCKSYGWTPLMHASREGWLDCVRLLLKFGAEVNTHDHMGQTALHRAAFRGHIDIVRELLHAGADPTTEDFLTQTPQHLATQEAHWKIQRKLDRAEGRWHKKLAKEAKLAKQDAKIILKLEQKMVQRRKVISAEIVEVKKLERSTMAIRNKNPEKNLNVLQSFGSAIPQRLSQTIIASHSAVMRHASSSGSLVGAAA